MGSMVFQAAWVFILSIIAFTFSVNASSVTLPVGAVIALLILKRLQKTYVTSFLAMIAGVLYSYNIISLGPLDRLFFKVTGQAETVKYLTSLSTSLKIIEPELAGCYEKCADCPKPLVLDVVIDQFGKLSSLELKSNFLTTQKVALSCVYEILKVHPFPPPPKKENYSVTLTFFDNP